MPAEQLMDDPELLETMLADYESCDPLYRPGNYWAVREEVLVKELQSVGLNDIRRRRSPYLRGFGVADPSPGGVGVSARRRLELSSKLRRLLRVPGTTWALDGFDRLINRLPMVLPYGQDVNRIQETGAELCRLKAIGTNARELSDFDISLAGNPEGVFEWGNRYHTIHSLYYYLRYVYVSGFENLAAVNTIAELGSGSGKQAEVVKKLHPHVTYLLFDIVPQLYVAEQYLKAVFPGQVVSYRLTRDAVGLTDLIQPGFLHILPSWKFPLLSNLEVDLFWNAASFQEMEPHIVANYLSTVNQSAQRVFLQELFTGKGRARGPGSPGVLRPTVLSDYREGLADFEMKDMSPCWTPMGLLREEGLYHDSWWERKPEG